MEVRQSTSLSPDKLYFHDQNDVTDVGQVDNVAGLPTQTEWITVGPGFLATLVKRGFQSDPSLAGLTALGEDWDPDNMGQIAKQHYALGESLIDHILRTRKKDSQFQVWCRGDSAK